VWSVRVLAQRGPQRRVEAFGVVADLALVDQALLVLVHELDGVLDGDDVCRALAVDVVDHGGQRGGLPRAGGPRHHHQPLHQVAELQDVRRELEILDGEDVGGDHPEDPARALAILEEIAAEAGQPGNLVGEVGVGTLLELAPPERGSDRVEHLAHPIRREGLRLREAHHGAILAEERRAAAGEVKVGAALADHPAEQRVHLRRVGRGRARCRLGGRGG
jgi:hypothetical protein